MERRSMVNINWQFQTMIAGGPAFIVNQPAIQVDAYDVVTVTVPATTNNVAVPIQPSSTVGDVVFLVITSSQYDPGITYTLDGLSVVHPLDSPHPLVCTGAVAFLNIASPPQNLTFNNT